MKPQIKNPNIDIGLSVLCAIASRGETLDQVQIAEVCNCSRSAISRIERRAMRKAKELAEKLDLHTFLEA
jgi:transcriptional regulator